MQLKISAPQYEDKDKDFTKTICNLYMKSSLRGSLSKLLNQIMRYSVP